jgi:hypothetical protein
MLSERKIDEITSVDVFTMVLCNDGNNDDLTYGCSRQLRSKTTDILCLAFFNKRDWNDETKSCFDMVINLFDKNVFRKE